MSDLPSGWEWASIGDVADVQLGRQRSPKNHSGAHMRPYLRSANVTWDGIDLTDVKEMNFDPWEAETFRLEPGDLLLNEASGSPNEVGKPAIWRGEIPDCCFQNTILRLRSGHLSTKYLYWYCRWQAITGMFGEAGRGVNIRHLGKQGLLGCRIPVAPRPEQGRVVAAIEEHLDRVEVADAAVRLSRGRLQVLLEQAMNTAFIVEAPTAALGDVATVGSGATPSRSNRQFWDGGDVPWVASGALNGRTVGEPSAFITRTALAETAVKLWPPGTVLVAMYGEGQTRGRASQLLIEATCNQACAAIRPDPAVLRSDFVQWYMNSRYHANRRLASGGVQPNLSLGLIKAISIPVPPLSVQDDIVRELAGIETVASRLRVQLSKVEQRAQALRRSILAAAFSGKLVPQDPGDEPAAVLLERIRAERVAAGVGKRARRVKA